MANDENNNGIGDPTIPSKGRKKKLKFWLGLSLIVLSFILEFFTVQWTWAGDCQQTIIYEVRLYVELANYALFLCGVILWVKSLSLSLNRNYFAILGLTVGIIIALPIFMILPQTAGNFNCYPPSGYPIETS